MHDNIDNSDEISLSDKGYVTAWQSIIFHP